MNPNTTSVRAQKIAHWVELHQDELVAFVSKLVAAESPSLAPGAQRAALGILAGELDALGFEVERVPGIDVGDHLLARQGHDLA